MIYHLLYPLHATFGVFRVFRYISFRVFMAMLTALLISFLLGPLVIRFLKARQHGSNNIREDVPERHQQKSGTPTMGGLLIVLSLLSAFLLWARLDVSITWITAFCTLGFAGIGYLDDILKLKKKKGLTIRKKFQMQLLVAGVVGLALVATGFDTHLQLPFAKDLSFDLGWWFFVPMTILVIVGSSNAVNLTDGLDGLAIGPTLIAAFTFLFFAYVAGNFEFARYLQVIPVRFAGELAIFCGALVGAGLGFLWFNTYPAQVFMGDVGSLALGAALGTVAVVTKQELLLLLVGGIFVIEAVSVIIQVLTFRTTGKRVFKMAPIHHHFELKGWAEPKVIVRFWIIAIILALVALSTLKLR
ncbi:MAG: phospho-N-acetylmuramoyl-pentapeptide-transferase [Pseudomonadota bacterium]